MVCQHLDDLYEMFLLGALGREESAVVREHLERSCPYCLVHLREAVESLYLLMLLSAPGRPSPKLKSQILSRLRKKR